MQIAARMRVAIADAAAAGAARAGRRGQPPAADLIVRCDAEGRPLFHDPRKRETHLASVTPFTFDRGRCVGVEYTQPAEGSGARQDGQEVPRRVVNRMRTFAAGVAVLAASVGGCSARAVDAGRLRDRRRHPDRDRGT